MPAEIRALLRLLGGTLRDIAPIVVIVAFFQIAVLRQPIADSSALALGLVSVIAGLTIFVRGLEMALFPLGEALAGAFVRKGSLALLLVFSFGLGFGTTVAEPALIAVADKAAEIMHQSGAIDTAPGSQSRYALALRYTVAVSVGVSLVVGVWRILKGWPIHVLIIGGYVGVVTLTAFAPPEIIGIAYDSGGVTTSTITVPLVAALGLGLAGVIRGRNPMIDGFGLIAFASLLPIVFVLAFGIMVIR